MRIETLHNIIIDKQQNTWLNQITQEKNDIHSARVNLKWKHRQELHPWLVKEEIYGAVLAEIIKKHPTLQQRINGLKQKKQRHSPSHEASQKGSTL